MMLSKASLVMNLSQFMIPIEIESFHRAIKQVCGICRFMVRDSQAIKTHIFCSLQAFVLLKKMRSEKKFFFNWYELQGTYSL